MESSIDTIFSTEEIDKAAEELWGTLFGLGPIPEKLAFNQAAGRLADIGLIDENSPHPRSKSYQLVRAAFDTAVEYGFLDTPKDGYFRAILTNAEDYETGDWQLCIFACMSEGDYKGMSSEEVVRSAVEWAKENLGLQHPELYPKSDVWKQVEEALVLAVKDKKISRNVFYGIERLQLIE